MLALALPGCENEDDAGPPVLTLESSSDATDPRASASEQVERFVSAPDLAGLVALLGHSHASARALLGPHHLHYRATFYTGPDPAELPLDQPLPDPVRDEPIRERFVIEDELDLRWVAAPGGAPHFELHQKGGEAPSARDVIVIGEQAWVQLDARGYFGRELEDDPWPLWLDDAQHAVRDAVELAAPRVELGAIAELELGGRAALRVPLQLGASVHAGRVVEPPHAWRRAASIDAISGEVVIDRATGLWLRATIEVAWHAQDSAGREVHGTLALTGEVEPLPDDETLRATIRPPDAAKPLIERDRPELLRERLLDGLAAP
jgi:hypothetical protein